MDAYRLIRSDNVVQDRLADIVTNEPVGRKRRLGFFRCKVIGMALKIGAHNPCVAEMNNGRFIIQRYPPGEVLNGRSVTGVRNSDDVNSQSIDLKLFRRILRGKVKSMDARTSSHRLLERLPL